jgi:hypothetical protein
MEVTRRESVAAQAGTGMAANIPQNRIHGKDEWKRSTEQDQPVAVRHAALSVFRNKQKKQLAFLSVCC